MWFLWYLWFYWDIYWYCLVFGVVDWIDVLVVDGWLIFVVGKLVLVEFVGVGVDLVWWLCGGDVVIVMYVCWIVNCIGL